MDYIDYLKKYKKHVHDAVVAIRRYVNSLCQDQDINSEELKQKTQKYTNIVMEELHKKF